MRRMYTIRPSRVTLFMVVPASLFIGFILQLFASVIHAPAGFIAAPLLCRDEVAVETSASSGASRTGRRITVLCGSQDDSAGPGFRPMGLPITQAPAEKDITFQTWAVSVLIYSAIAFVLLQLRRRRRQRTGESRRRE